MPLHGEDGEDIVGLVYTKDLIRAEREGRGDTPALDLVRPVRFVPENKPVSRLMREMQAGKFHLAIVADEYGGIVGLITLEDCLEELVGEIVDEYDIEALAVQRLPDGDYLVDGGVQVEDLNELLDADLPDEEWDTRRRLPVRHARTRAEPGESVEHGGWRFAAEEVDGRRIRLVRITPLPPERHASRRAQRSADRPDPGPPMLARIAAELSSRQHVTVRPAVEISLDGKVALVTGASKGIGKAIAARLGRVGREGDAEQSQAGTARSAAAEIDGETAIFAANAGDLDSAAACVAATIETFGGLDILVNNAATNPYFGPTLGVDPARYDKTFQVNLRGPLFWCRRRGSGRSASQPGVILNIASIGGLRAEYGLGVYNVTKAALIHLTRQLAGELGPTRVVGIAPGLVQTDFSALLVENFGDALVPAMPTQRLGEPEDIANLAVFLASDRASWITGETYVIDGGAGVCAFRSSGAGRSCRCDGAGDVVDETRWRGAE